MAKCMNSVPPRFTQHGFRIDLDPDLEPYTLLSQADGSETGMSHRRQQSHAIGVIMNHPMTGACI